ncbi:MAG: gliding motility-associated C-terminal domain-containing protein [Bacteroidales bacterium]
MNCIKKILFIIFLFVGLTSNGQIIGPNLVQNPSFEDFSSCPILTSELYKSNFWWGVSADYYNSCSIAMGVPTNFSGFQYANTGVAYAGFILYWHHYLNPSNNTYIESAKNILKDSLIKDKRYCVRYFISLGEYTVDYAIANNSIIIYDSIGALFSVNQVQDDTNPIICDTCAKYTKSIVGVDTVNWFKISGSIIAKGGEKYLTIGKFDIMNWLQNISCKFYVYVDDVSVCECAYHINLGEDTKFCQDETMLLNATLPNATYLWQDGSTNAIYEVKQPGTYWVTAYVADYDITTSDTIVITAEDEAVCHPPALRIPNSFSPNSDGLNDKFEYFYTEYYDIKTYIYNRWGQMIFEGENTNFWDGTFNGKAVQLGVYAYTIEAMDKRSKIQKVYSGRVTVVN